MATIHAMKAKEKCWIAKDLKSIVKDGSADAVCLLARKGELMRPEKLARYKNAEDFFEESTASAKTKKLTEPPKSAVPDESTKDGGKTSAEAKGGARRGH